MIAIDLVVTAIFTKPMNKHVYFKMSKVIAQGAVCLCRPILYITGFTQLRSCTFVFQYFYILRSSIFFLFFSSAGSQAIVVTFRCSGRVSPPYLWQKNERIQTKLGRKKLRQQGNLQENLAADRMRVAPTFLSVCMSPARLTPPNGKDHQFWH